MCPDVTGDDDMIDRSVEHNDDALLLFCTFCIDVTDEARVSSNAEQWRKHCRVEFM
jgi:hypothetical protein